MWHITPILYLTCIHAYQIMPNNPYAPYVIDDRFPSRPSPVAPVLATYPEYQAHALNHPINYNPQKPPGPYQPPYMEPYMHGVKSNFRPVGYYLRSSNINLRRAQSTPKMYQGGEAFPFDTDYASIGGSELSFSEPDPIIEPRLGDNPSYNEDLELVEGFGNYLRRRTLIDPQASTSINDAAHQYNALLAVLIALARVIRNSCADFEQVYDQLYYQTVENYYKYGLANADKVAAMIEDYIQKGNSHMPKLRKLKQEICDKELFCSVSVDIRIKSTPLLFVKELETLEALAHLSRSYYPYIEEFDQAAQKGTVLAYLQRSKERLKEYIMHVINSVEHLTDRQVKC